MKLQLLPVIALTCLATMHTEITAAPFLSSEDSKLMVVERSGKPPFKRSFVQAKGVDVAQFETVSAANCEEVKVVNMRGKPPFKRSTECVEMVDMAQFEVSDETKATDFKGRPPFKRH
ncbi:MAG: hypothetical protein HWE26_13285 [Alteromonadaceae bacterium]|nr:hypothetical protein [Alteromonadaceae bacterium]